MKTVPELNCRDEGGKADFLLVLLMRLDCEPTEVEEFLKGLVVRQRSILMDSATILDTRDPRYVSTAFILLRALLDDFARLCFVLSSDNQEEALVLITADAYRHRFNTWAVSMEFNNDIYQGKSESLISEQALSAKKEEFRKDPDNKKYLEPGKDLTFRKFETVKDTFDRMKKRDDMRGYVHALALYKHLSGHVHFSPLAYHDERIPERRAIEMRMIQEILFYAERMRFFVQDFFSRAHSTVPARSG